ncbi:hypothetical protein MXB_2721, partial [Myxobolus squamalis]
MQEYYRYSTGPALTMPSVYAHGIHFILGKPRLVAPPVFLKIVYEE